MNVGVVLSGGAAKGAYQIGALKALREFVPRQDIKYMSCASVGVLNGYAYATDRLEHAEQMWRKLCADDTKIFVSRVIRSSRLQEYIAELPGEGCTLPSAFYASLLDINSRNVVYKDLSGVPESSIPLYLKASVAIPAYNRAVQIRGASYYDGAIIDNIPVFPLLKHNLDYIICIYSGEDSCKFESTYFDNKIIKIAFPCEKLVREYFVFEQEGIEDRIREGYRKAMHLFKFIFSQGCEDLEYIYSAIEFMNQNKGGNLRITGDVIVTNFNKVTQKLTKRKVL